MNSSYLSLFENEEEFNIAESEGKLLKPNVSYIKESRSLKYRAFDPTNGYEYVDLGLPSGTHWAKCNIGAEKESDYGLYFAWGETAGYKDASSGKIFSPNDYKFKNEDACDGKFKYNSSDNKTVLELEDDAASVNMGGSWHMPSKEQFEELINTSYTTTTWTFVNGVSGREITSKTNGNTLFLPGSGFCDWGSVDGVGIGCYWSSSLFGGDPSSAWYLLFGEGDEVGVSSDDRWYGHSVRGVMN